MDWIDVFVRCRTSMLGTDPPPTSTRVEGRSASDVIFVKTKSHRDTITLSIYMHIYIYLYTNPETQISGWKFISRNFSLSQKWRFGGNMEWHQCKILIHQDRYQYNPVSDSDFLIPIWGSGSHWPAPFPVIVANGGISAPKDVKILGKVTITGKTFIWTDLSTFQRESTKTK